MYEGKNIIRNQAKSSNRDRIGQTVPKRSSQEVRNKRKDDSALDVEIPKGYRRIRDDLQHDFGINVNDKRVLKICRAKKIKSTIKYSRHGCTRSASSSQYVAENVLKRDFHAPKPNMKWLTDVTEFKWYEGVEVHKIYLNKKTSGTHATGLTHECHSLYGIIIPILCPICKGTFAQELHWAFCADCTMQTLWKITFEAMKWFVI